MSQTNEALTARAIASTALQLIGRFPPKQQGPDPYELRRTLQCFSEVLDHLGGTREMPWRREFVTITLAADTETYNLATLTRDPSGCEGVIIEHWGEAYLIRPGLDDAPDIREPVDVLFEGEWANRRQQPASPGAPEAIWIERRLEPILHVWPVPDVPNVDDDTEYSIEITAQIEMPFQTVADGQRQMPLPKAWRLYLAYATAAHAGQGPICHLPDNRWQRLERKADELSRGLFAYSRPEHRRPRIAQPWGHD